jgi:hypothetical protein
MGLQEVPTSGCLSQRTYYEHPEDKREYRIVVRFMMTPLELTQFIEEMLDRGASRVRAEASGDITFVEAAGSL